MIFGGLLAGGRGTRMESAKVPKQFIEVAGVPVFIRSLKTFLGMKEVDAVIISVNIDWQDKYCELIEQHHIPKDRVVLVEGGERRFTSLINVVKKAYEICNDSIVISHDCARIFVSEDILRRNIIALNDYRIVTTSIPVIDTIIQSKNGKLVTDVPNREQLWADQGPQSFYAKEFLSCLNQLSISDYDQYIEAGKLFIANQIEVGIVQGSRLNYKITNDVDLAYAEFLIERGLI